MKMDKAFYEDMSTEEKHKFTSMDDVITSLQCDLINEIADSHKYCQMAEAAKENDSDAYKYFTEMAKDEYTHAYFIHNYLIEHDVFIPEEREVAFKELKEKMKSYF